jgi:TonB family protein
VWKAALETFAVARNEIVLSGFTLISLIHRTLFQLGTLPPLISQTGIALAFSHVGYWMPFRRGVVYTRFGWGKRILVAAAATVFTLSLASAQQSTVEEGKRKVKTKTAPAYPDLARRMNITGRVKLELVIAPDGHVKTARAMGGHPVLVQPCVDSVKDWRFESAPEETTQVVEFEFKGGN